MVTLPKDSNPRIRFHALLLLRMKVQGIHPCIPVRSFASDPGGPTKILLTDEGLEPKGSFPCCARTLPNPCFASGPARTSCAGVRNSLWSSRSLLHMEIQGSYPVGLRSASLGAVQPYSEDPGEEHQVLADVRATQTAVGYVAHAH
jgi:hypothetical protein